MAFEPLPSRGTGLRELNFESLVRQHQGFIRAWLRRLTEGDTALADDLAQDTFLRALRGLDGFRSEAQPRTWLARIALHVFPISPGPLTRGSGCKRSASTSQA